MKREQRVRIEITAVVLLLAVAVGVVLFGCASCVGLPRMVETDRVRPALDRVLVRHDALARTSTLLDDQARTVALAQSARVRELVVPARVTIDEVAPVLREVLARHDRLVEDNRAADTLELATALATSDALRLVFEIGPTGTGPP